MTLVVRSSIRVRITAVAAAVVAAVLAITSVGLVNAQMAQLTRNLDVSLRRQVDDVASLLGAGTTPVVSDQGEAGFLVVVLPDGTEHRSVPASVQLALPTSAATGQFVTAYPFAGDDDPFRLAVRTVTTPTGKATVYAGANLDDVRESASALSTSLWVAIPLVVGVLAGLVWWLVGRTLVPVEAIRREVADIGDDVGGRRVPVPRNRDEIQRLAETMNRMLDRVEAGTARQRQFAADASHELRSPLARIRSELDVDLSHREGVDPWQTHQSVLDEVVGMEALVGDLLHLARSDAGRGRLDPTPVDLDAIVLDEVRRLRNTSPVTIDAHGVSAAEVRGDPAELGRAVRNVLENAVRHAATSVKVEAGEDKDGVVVAVTDDGPGIPVERQHEIFDRFSRLDQARSRSHGGTGLGLAIASDILRRHGGTIGVDPHHRPGARIVLRLPAVV